MCSCPPIVVVCDHTAAVKTRRSSPAWQRAWRVWRLTSCTYVCGNLFPRPRRSRRCAPCWTLARTLLLQHTWKTRCGGMATEQDGPQLSWMLPCGALRSVDRQCIASVPCQHHSCMSSRCTCFDLHVACKPSANLARLRFSSAYRSCAGPLQQQVPGRLAQHYSCPFSEAASPPWRSRCTSSTTARA